ncbi:MAG: hypothetical protein CVT48_06610 [Thermoplasmata archaeon HGW-Thermoplasmata-1]|nr:MAG: hypothetical protein CVT48_06610 [Thermoplasmata archaeon HGW-Thermoplasmata-1]
MAAPLAGQYGEFHLIGLTICWHPYIILPARHRLRLLPVRLPDAAFIYYISNNIYKKKKDENIKKTPNNIYI